MASFNTKNLYHFFSIREANEQLYLFRLWSYFFVIVATNFENEAKEILSDFQAELILFGGYFIPLKVWIPGGNIAAMILTFNDSVW